MMLNFLPVRKFKRNGRYIVFGAVLTVALLAAYLEFRATSEWSSSEVTIRGESVVWAKAAAAQRAVKEDRFSDENRDEDKWKPKNTQLTWRTEYKGQANLHVFDDWCGSSIAQLRKNLHYPLYPHRRTTVKKLAVSPSWTNYGLRIFGYIHPYTDGDFLFALASDDNSEFWLSDDDNPDNLKLIAYVGKTGREWTAPGEYGKYASQISDLVPLQANKKYFFELIHKQNGEGTDHVEVAWQLKVTGSGFAIIDSKFISLYTNESSLKAGDVSHIPQTAASHVNPPSRLSQTPPHDVDMLRADPRDSFHQIPLLDQVRLHGVLPDCIYNPSYIIKGYPLVRYQGLQFVYLTYVYPNDYTRLTHMESENKCFYRANPYYMDRYGFSNYIQMDVPEEELSLKFQGDSMLGRNKNKDLQKPREYEEKQQIDGMEKKKVLPDYGDDYDDYSMNRRRKLFSVQKHSVIRRKRNNGELNIRIEQENQAKEIQKLPEQPQNEPQVRRKKKRRLPQQQNLKDQQHLQNAPSEVKSYDQGRKQAYVVEKIPEQQNPELFQEKTIRRFEEKHLQADRSMVKKDRIHRLKAHYVNSSHVNPNPAIVRDIPIEKVREAIDLKEKSIKKPAMFNEVKNEHPDVSNQMDNRKVFLGEHVDKARKNSSNAVELKKTKVKNATYEYLHGDEVKADAMKKPKYRKQKVDTIVVGDNQIVEHNNKAYNNIAVLQKPHQNMVYNQTSEHKDQEYNNRWGHANEDRNRIEKPIQDDAMDVKETEDDGDEEDDWVNQGLSEEEDYEHVHRPVFDVEVKWNQTFHAKSLDLHSMRSDWIDLKCNVSGNLMLGESEALSVVDAFMKELNKKYPRQFSLDRIVNVEKKPDYNRGSRYLLELDLLEASGRHLRLGQYIFVKRTEDWGSPRKQKPQDAKLQLCNPYTFYWNPTATVHFIIPVKNQARWVKQFISDMEELYRITGDQNFNIIITDYESTDMNIEEELLNSYIPRYQYLRLSGNFERSAGLQAGIDLITDDNSIVFLCDLHIHFPPGFIDTVRKHCVERRMAFAPIVMRLNCGATPQEPDGYWEVNGFGLLGIYKSDLDRIGGMNTKEFTDRWGGEDWELLDRILQGGLEVERLYLRNFFHYFHSKRGMWNRRSLRNT
ncbi:beta-1,4-N-acetylgalactosaminyltransferase 3 [Danio aesculapii]|uniref:beta-1,4-N-acetylgalactosaminyltransferase 3 n=1 Tax=Danio aesculapii TaxID=1142201 RepID=UPI0024BFE72C|nr:beta-1,4-N-acetylgalactosaminyltransferase 3 [Danio aesculapii]